MTDLRTRVGKAMQATKPRKDGHVMFEDVRDAAIKAVLRAQYEAALSLPMARRSAACALLVAFKKANRL